MIPYNPLALHVIWFNAWRSHIASAKAHPHQNEGYCRAALICQAYYVMHLALEMAKR